MLFQSDNKVNGWKVDSSDVVDTILQTRTAVLGGVRRGKFGGALLLVARFAWVTWLAFGLENRKISRMKAMRLTRNEHHRKLRVSTRDILIGL